MNNKMGVILLASIITLISVYQISFTFKSRSIEDSMTAYAERKVAAAQADSNATEEKLDSVRRMAVTNYKDSIRDENVYSILGMGYTYREVKKNDLNLGLDLQGGMHVTLVVSADGIVKAMSNDPNNEVLLASLTDAKAAQQTEQRKFTELFYEAYQERADGQPLRNLFMSASNKEVFNQKTTDEEVLAEIDSELDQAIDRVVIVLRERIDRFGASNPQIQAVKSSGRIEIELPGADDEARIKRQLSAEAKLEFFEVIDFSKDQVAGAAIGTAYGKMVNKMMADVNVNIDNIEATPASAGGDEEGPSDDLFDDAEITEINAADSTVPDSLKLQTVASPESLTLDSTANAVAASDSAIRQEKFRIVSEYLTADQQGNFYSKTKHRERVIRYLESPEFRKYMGNEYRLMLGKISYDEESGNEPTEWTPVYWVKRRPVLAGDVVNGAGVFVNSEGENAVSMSMNTQGTQRWAQLTRGYAPNQTRVAIVLDNIVYSAPSVMSEISGGTSSITGSFNSNKGLEEAKDLANILKAGRLPAPTQIERMVTVGPSLGQEAVDRGLVSLLCGLALVVLFMILYYGKGGIVANIALLINLFFIIGVLSTPTIEASLTLPGIAGIVLTIGMSIDANVLIFERIREELALGKDIKNAINSGYQKAFWTIFDANITTFFTGMILFIFGSGLVKGFAVTLMIGIACSFFSAVFITRLIIEWMSRKKGSATNISFTTGISKSAFKNLKFNFIGKRRIAYIFSSIVIAVGISTIVAQGGLNLGVAFEGGRTYIMSFDEDVNSVDVKSALAGQIKDAGLEVKAFDGNDKMQITTSYLIDSPDDNADSLVTAAVTAGIGSKFNDLNPTILSHTEVGPTIADDIRNTSIESIIVALIVIFLYIIFRFRKWQFGTGALFALFHDVLIVISVFSIFRLIGISFEIDEVFIAAMLTIVGYSINDTVVVFDRVREFLKLDTKSDLGKILNDSLNSTLSRTMMTSVTTLLVIVILLVFGGEALRGFSFALLIGVIIGTYSSIFIATPIVLDASSMKKKKPAPSTDSAS